MAVHLIIAGLQQAFAFFWDSFYGLVFGFLISAVTQVMLTPRVMERYLGPGLRGVLYGTGFGIIASACSYGAAAAARGFYRAGADPRSVFAFLISSTNMNVAILILFWTMLGWKFAFAEFFGGAIIIAIVMLGMNVLVGSREMEGMREDAAASASAAEEHHHCCGGATEKPASRVGEIVAAMLADIRMLRTELFLGYLIAGYAAALVPAAWLSSVLRAVGSVPYLGGLLLLAFGLLLASVTFVCSMGNVPLARFLASAGIPLGANTAFIYGDLLVPPLVAIYRKSFPPRIVWTFIGLFVVGAMAAGAIMELLIGQTFGGASMGSMALNDRLTMVANGLAVVILGGLLMVRGWSR